MRLSSLNAGIIAIVFGVIFAFPLAIAGSMIFVSRNPGQPSSITNKAHRDTAFISGSVDYGSRR